MAQSNLTCYVALFLLKIDSWNNWARKLSERFVEAQSFKNVLLDPAGN